MSKVQMLRCLVNQRLTAAAEEIFGLFERTIAEYEEELSRSKEENERTQRQLRAALIPQLRLHRADVQQLLVVKEEFPPEQQELNSSLDQEDPEPPDNKEDQEDPEPPHIKEDCGGPEPGRNSDPDRHQGPDTDENTGDSSDTDDSDDWKETRPRWSAEADGEDCGGPEPGRNSDPDRHQAQDTDEKTGDSSDTDDSDDWKETRPRCSADVQQLLVVKEEVPHEQQEWSSSLDQEDPEPPNIKEEQEDPEPPHIKEEQENPEPPHIKEEQEDLWTSQEGEQLQGLEEADVKFSFTPVKTEDDEEEAQSSQLHQRQTEQMETEADGEDYGGPESVRNSDPDRHQGPNTDEKTGDSSDTDYWGKTREPQSGLNSVKPDEVHVSVSRRSAGEKLFSCSECGNTFIYHSQLTTHMRIHTGEKPFSCTVCQKSFNQRSHLQAHMRTHTREKPYSYSVFHQRQTERMETEADGEDCGGPEPGRNSDPDRHQGPDTDEKTVDSSDTDDWKETREPQSGLNSVKPDEVHVSDSRRSAGEKLFSCSECGNTFNYRSNLTTHMRIHTGEKPFSCSVCKTSFNQLSTLQTHMRTHTGEKPFSCSVCQKSFNQGSTLQAHVRTHTREKPFSSSVCQKYFNGGSTLQEHMRIHTGEKPFSCSVCQKSFNHYSHLKRHMATHTGEKPYSCSVCKNSFIERSTLLRHMRIHTGEKPYSCSVCKNSFNHRSHLKRHMRIHTAEKP